MLIIRKEQWGAMENPLHVSFESRAMVELRSSYPKRLENVEDEVLREDVRIGIRKAEGFGLTDDSFVIKFLEFIVEYGRDFTDTEETAWARDILENQYYEEEEKLTELSRYRTLEMMEA